MRASRMVGVRFPRPVAVAGRSCFSRQAATGAGRRTSRPDGASDSASSTVAEPAVSPPSVVTMADYDPRFFDEISHIVDHPWFPLEPGTRFVFRGSALDGKQINLASRSRIRNRMSRSRPTERFRACCVTHAESGFLVTPRTSTRLDPSSMVKSTYSVRSHAVSTVKKSRAKIA